MSIDGRQIVASADAIRFVRGLSWMVAGGSSQRVASGQRGAK